MNYIISIIAPEALTQFDKICEELHLPLNMLFRARGTAVKSMLDLLGIESNEWRVILSVANEENTKKLIAMEKEKLHIGVPGHGVVIALPIKSIGGGKTMALLSGENNPSTKYTPSINYAYELIIAIAEEGYTDMVMNAARAAGARGGTVLHGKGTGVKGVEKFYNISIASEREVILIIAPSEEKSDIMRSILKEAGPDTEADTHVFSLPVTEVAGFGFLEEN